MDNHECSWIKWLLCADREVVRAERRGREPGLIVKIAGRVGGPAVADGQRLGKGRVGNEDHDKAILQLVV